MGAIASPMTWIATIVRHGAIDALRKRQFDAYGSEDEDQSTIALLRSRSGRGNRI